MGEYAFFVWPCYAAAVILLTILGVSSWNNKRRDEQKLAKLQDQLNNSERQE